MASESDQRRAFLIDTFKVHIDHIRAGQARRFEILRYAFIGYFAYWAFLLSVDKKQLLCGYAFESVVLIPGFLLFQVFLYIWIVNRNIVKHARYIEYLFNNGLNELGVGPNLYREFLMSGSFPVNAFERLLARFFLHYSQVVLVILSMACVVLYGYLRWTGGFARLAGC